MIMIRRLSQVICLLTIWLSSFPSQCLGQLITLKELFAIGGESDTSFFQPLDIVSLLDGSFVVADAGDFSIKKFDARGNFISKVGRRGRGPGEFVGGPRRLCYFKGIIAVSAYDDQRIQFFNDHLEYRSSFIAKKVVGSMDFDPKGNLWIHFVGSREKSPAVVKYNLDGIETRTITLNHQSSSHWENEGALRITSLGDIIFAYSVMNKVEVWDTSGLIRSEFSISKYPEKVPFRKLPDGSEAPENLMFGSIMVDQSSNIYIKGSHFARNSARDVDVFDRTGKHLYAFTLPAKIRQMSILGDRFYTIESNTATIRVFQWRRD